jgi:glutamine synthetase
MGGQTKDAERTIALLKKEKVSWLALQFVDLMGGLQNITSPVDQLSVHDLLNGFGKLDGSSIKGFKEIHESDMLMVPDPTTMAILPWFTEEHKTARMFVDIYEGFSRQRFSRDSRFVAQTAEGHAAKMGYDTTYWGPELEFFVFDSVKLLPSPIAVRDSWAGCGYAIESSEAPWSTEGGKTPPIKFKEGYYPAPPHDSLLDFRNEACRILRDCFHVTLDAHHHEVATAGQCEINMKYDTMVAMADKVVTCKYVLKMVANRMGKICTFMPKPIFGDNASGMHVHQSLWNKGKNIFYDPNDKYAEISQTGRYYIGGLMEHARALCAITNPTTNSYRRLVPGYEAPVFIAWSRNNRSANVRIPMYHKGHEKTKRVEYRTPDPSSNIYLAQAAMLLAGLDGIKRKIDPGRPCDEDIYKLSPSQRKSFGIRELPGSLVEAIEALKSDMGFLKPAFPTDLLERYIAMKMNEHLQVAIRPTPYEFYQYLEC